MNNSPLLSHMVHGWGRIEGSKGAVKVGVEGCVGKTMYDEDIRSETDADVVRKEGKQPPGQACVGDAEG